MGAASVAERPLIHSTKTLQHEDLEHSRDAFPFHLSGTSEHKSDQSTTRIRDDIYCLVYLTVLSIAAAFYFSAHHTELRTERPRTFLARVAFNH